MNNDRSQSTHSHASCWYSFALALSIMILLLLGVETIETAFADTAAGNTPTSATGQNWTTPTGATAYGGANAGYNNAGMNNLILKGFNLSIPDSSTINGVTAYIYGYGTGGTATTRRIRANLTLNGSAANGTWKTALAQNTTMTLNTVGAVNDLWGMTGVSGAAVNSANFGLLITDDNTTAGQIYIDYAYLSVDYTPPVSCTYADPTVTISANQNANQGGTNNYTVSVTSNDTTGCSNTTFSVSKTDNPSVPNANFSASTLGSSIGPIDPGDTLTMLLAHTVTTGATVGATLTSYATTASDANHGAVNSNTITSTVTDGYIPSSSITSPLNNAVLNLASASPTTISGTAADTTGGSGIASVAINVGGGNFVAATCSNCPTSGSATANWSYNWTLPAVQSTGYNIQSRATDVSGRFSGGSGNIMVTVDRVRPGVSSTVPTTGAANVVVNNAVTINWNENVDCASVTTSSVTILPSVTWNKTSCSGTQAVFTPSGQNTGTGYTVTASTAVTDTAGNAMSSSYNWGYTTAGGAPAPDPPTGLSLSNMTRHGPQVSWTGVSGATDYNIYRSDDNATWGSAIGNVLDPATTYTDNNAPLSNTVYYWTVTAKNGGSESTKPTAVMGKTSLHKGYNMISAPYNTTSLSPTTVFGVWANWSWLWQSAGNVNPDTNGVYVKPNTLTPGKSVFTWAWDEATTLSGSGTANGSSITVSLLPGWNMISNQTASNMNSISSTWLIDGSPIMAAINGTAPFSVPVIGGAISWWDGNTYDTGNIVSNPPVEPWKGYFILNLDSVSHTLTIQ